MLPSGGESEGEDGAGQMGLRCLAGEGGGDDRSRCFRRRCDGLICCDRVTDGYLCLRQHGRDASVSGMEGVEYLLAKGQWDDNSIPVEKDAVHCV
jgi:hypothetical protein